MSSNKPFPSSDLDVFKENSLILDNFVNSQENEYPDRFARKRPTITGIIKEAFNVRTDISNMNETLIGQSRWDVVPKNTSLSLGGDNGALNKQAQALFNRTEMLKTHAREVLRRTYQEAGYNLVEGSFEQGGTLNNATDVLLQERTGKAFSGPAGTVAAGTNPASGGIGSGGWIDRSDVTLRSGLAADGGVGLVSGVPFICAESYGGSNDTEIMQAAVNDAIAKKILFVTFNRDYNVTGTILNRQEVIFLGCHKITGAGSYRMRIVRGNEPSMPILDGISAKQLPKFSSKSSPVVVVVGDSISTYQPNTLDRVGSQYRCIVDKIKRDNPDKTPIFYNRAIGGQMFKDLDTVPTGFVDWYTNQSTPWLDYVSALNPDLVIVSMGMNDSRGISFKALNSVITKIKAFASAPDLVMLTPMVPSTNGGGSYDAGYGSRSAQDGRDYAAGAIRAYCIKHKLPCIDVNRVFNVMRDGFDILDTYNVRLTGAAVTNGAYTSPVECRNWSAKITMPDRAAYNFGDSPFAVRVGPDGAESVFIQLHTDNTIKLSIWNILGGAVVYVPSQLIPDSPHQLSIDVYNQKIRVYLSKTSTDTMPDWVQLTVGGGLYHPAIGGYNNSYAAGGMTSVDEFNYGEHVRYMPSLTNTQMWGVGDGAAGTKLPYGGNGINHPTSMGIAVFRTALDACDFTAKSVVQAFTHAQNGGYETKDGKVIRVWGLLKPAELADRVDKRITWPVTITSGALVFTASWGVLQVDLTQVNRGAQTILTCGLPNYEGVDITFHNLNLPLAGRYAAWELNITY